MVEKHAHSKKILIIAGEESGELHGSSLMRELKNIDPELKFYGIGGDRMIANGLMNLFHIKAMAFMGFAEVVKHLPFIRSVQRTLLRLVKKENIKYAILIDYPGFNLNFAKKLKRQNVKILYYISPQLWAWGKNRVRKIKKLVNKLIVVFPFEKNFYKNYGVDVEFAGHPLLEILGNYSFMNKDELYSYYNLESGKEIILIMPGSRNSEIKKILPTCIDAVEKIRQKLNINVVVACSPNIEEKIVYEIIGERKAVVIKNRTYDLMKHAKFGIIKSGTSTLEASLLSLPFVVVYSTSKMTYTIGKFLVNVENIAMPNIIAGKQIVKEFIQNEFTVGNISSYCIDLITDENKLGEIRNNLSEIKSKLGEAGASKRAAEIIYTQLNEL